MSKLPWQLLQDFIQFSVIHPTFLSHSPEEAHKEHEETLSVHDDTET